MTDELGTPLGFAAATTPKRALDGSTAAAAAVLLAALGLSIFVAVVEDPLGGEPVALAGIERRLPERPPGQLAAGPTAKRDVPSIPIQADGTAAPAGPLLIKVPEALARAAPALGSVVARPQPPSPALLEQSGYGALPRIADDGRRPSDLYARGGLPTDDKRPKVALLIGGLGIAGAAAAEAIARLPAEVSLGFAPHAADLGRSFEQARADGHEIVLQVPMEPFEDPERDPAPQTLLTSLPAAANVERLRWAMGRAAGYVGLSPLGGARFAASEEALVPVLTEAARRGLLFLDDGASPRSLVAGLGPKLGASVARADGVIDQAPSAAEIDAALARLEERARRDGAAFATGRALPLTLARVERWAGELARRGILLVPVSAVAERPSHS